MVSFVYRSGSGIAGDVQDNAKSLIETRYLDSVNTPTYFGEPVKLVNGLVESIQSGDDVSVFYGILTRSVPGLSGNTYNGAASTAAMPNPFIENGICVQGYIKVICSVGTPAAYQPVYLRTTASGGNLVGQLEATFASGFNVLLPNVVWAVGGLDNTNVSVIRIMV